MKAPKDNTLSRLGESVKHDCMNIAWLLYTQKIVIVDLKLGCLVTKQMIVTDIRVFIPQNFVTNLVIKITPF